MEKQKTQQTGQRGKQCISLAACLIACLLTLLLGIGCTVGFFFARMDRETISMLQAMSTIRSRFVGEYDWAEVVDQSLGTMVTGLGDRWSYFLTEEEYRQVLEKRQNRYVGVGVTIAGTQDGEGIEILRVEPESPAGHAGIAAGDVILAVDGQVVTAENRADAIERIGGEAGSLVTLELRMTGGFTRIVELTRAEIQTKPVSYRMLENQQGYVRIKNFYESSAADMKAAVDALVAQGAVSLVFDLRDNPGGYVTELVAMLDHLLGEGLIFQSTELDGQQELYYAKEGEVNLPFAVFVSKDSYSAAEFFAAQLRESRGSVIVGEQTSGKGFAQQIFGLANGSAIGVSTAHYETGKGVSLIGTGLVPDEACSLSPEQQRLFSSDALSPADDPAIDAATRALAAGQAAGS